MAKHAGWGVGVVDVLNTVALTVGTRTLDLYITVIAEHEGTHRTNIPWLHCSYSKALEILSGNHS